MQFRFFEKGLDVFVAVLVDSSLLSSNLFLLLQPQRLWASDQDYIKASEIVKNMEVVNDVAERNVKLCTDYICQTRYETILYTIKCFVRIKII